MAYPSSIDSYTAVNGTTNLSPVHSGLHNTAGSALIQIENKLGIGSGSASADKILVGSGAGTTAWTSTWNNGVLGTPTMSNGFWGTARITGGTIISTLMGTNQITGGTLANASIGTPTILGGTVALSGTTTALSIGGAFVPSGGSLTDSAGGTWTVNAQANQVYYSVLGTAAGNRTIATPVNPTAWQTINFGFKSSGSANGTLVFSSGFLPSADLGTPTLGTGTSWSWSSWRYNPIDTKWHAQGAVTNLI